MKFCVLLTSSQKVWMAEEKRKEEEKKLAEWRRELAEEKEVESLKRIQEKETGQRLDHKSSHHLLFRKEIVGFLYQQPAGIDDDEAMNLPFKDTEAASDVKKVHTIYWFLTPRS